MREKQDGSQDLRLVLGSHINREERHSYDYKVVAIDGGSPARNGSIDIFIAVEDVNDHSPVFVESVYNVTVSELAPINSVIATVTALDPDVGRNGEVRKIKPLMRQACSLMTASWKWVLLICIATVF